MDTDLNHACLQWRVQANLILVTKICLERPCGRAGNASLVTTIGRGAAQARGLGRAWAVVRGRWLSGQRKPSRARVYKNLRSGARALREYTYDSSPKQKTVHVSVKLR
eukprot:6196421-Pleurochrysis_carterae.AAC.1